MKQDRKPILCLDFDGVIHLYDSPWQGARHIPDQPVGGAMEFIRNAQSEFTIHIYSSRSKSLLGRRAMKKWLATHMEENFGPAIAGQCMKAICWPIFKPPAFLTIDDRAMRFDGSFPEVYQLLAFKPWNKQGS